MPALFKNFVTYIKNLINGEEYISDRTKLTYTMATLSFVHVLIAIFFAFWGNTWLILYNIASFFLYQWLMDMAKKKHYVVVTILACIEIVIFVLITSFTIGTIMRFNLYCLALVPGIFYITSTIKDFKGKTLFPFLFSIVSMLTFVTSLLFELFREPLFVIEPSVGTQLIEIFNVIIVYVMMIIFSLLFTWEMKNNSAALEKRNQQLQQFANRDPLTKLPNRRSMMQVLNVSMHELQRDNAPFSVILGDIDDFKKVNDNYGHDAGDKVLVMVANTITSQLRDCDSVCRWGGEEILIIIKGDLEASRNIAERIRLNISSSKVEHNNQTLRVTMTFGVAQAKAGDRIEHLIQQADNRLYYGKGHGKNQVVSQNMP
ncbi:MAG: GGDEF domain-containing protein [Lachnospiraceae bacterium]|nr:GGDEF domain-containing protein [Lachnospiraceae bacterium]